MTSANMNKPLSTLIKACPSCFSRALMAAFVATCVAGCNLDFIKSAENLKADARQSFEAKNFSDAAAIAQKLTEKAPTDYEGYFLLAQAKAQVGDKNAAIVALEQAIKKGLKDDDQIDKNINLDSIKSMAAYTDLMNASFPSRKTAQEKSVSTAAVVSSEASASVSIHEADGKQVVRAGDVAIEVPIAK